MADTTHSPSYAFLLGVWVRRTATEDQIKAMVPRWITQAECDEILATPQQPLQ